MPQMHLYLRDELAEQVRLRARSQGVSVSRWLAQLVERECALHWPEGYLEQVVGGWKGEPLTRPPQAEDE